MRTFDDTADDDNADLAAIEEQGRIAYSNGDHQNPHPTETARWDAWQQGHDGQELLDDEEIRDNVG